MLTPPAALNAILFASNGPISKKEAAKVLGLKEGDLSKAVTALTHALIGTGTLLVESSSDLELRTSPDASELVKKLRETQLTRDLGKASLETLAVIAYREGSTRGEIDWVRGVNSSTSLRTLLMRGLINGREDPNDKRKIHYTLTTEALGHLGIARQSDLPRYEELSQGARNAIATEREKIEEAS
jgi:segregation and condensation protein B